MSLRRYVPTGRGGPFAFTAVLAVAVVGGVVIGALEGAIDPWFSLFVIFPLLIGLAAASRSMIELSKSSSPSEMSLIDGERAPGGVRS